MQGRGFWEGFRAKHAITELFCKQAARISAIVTALRPANVSKCCKEVSQGRLSIRVTIATSLKMTLTVCGIAHAHDATKKCQPKLQWHTDLCQPMQHVHLLQKSPALRHGSLHTQRSRFFATTLLHCIPRKAHVRVMEHGSLISRRKMFAQFCRLVYHVCMGWMCGSICSGIHVPLQAILYVRSCALQVRCTLMQADRHTRRHTCTLALNPCVMLLGPSTSSSSHIRINPPLGDACNQV